MSAISQEASSSMRTSRLKRPLAMLGAAALLAGVTVTLGASAATAAALPSGGYLTPTPATGNNNTLVTLDTSGPCANPLATNLVVKIFGAGFPATGTNVRGNTPIASFASDTAGRLNVSLADTLSTFGNLQTPPVVFSGAYSLVLTCRPNIGTATYGDFTTKIFFTTPTAYQVAGPTAAASTTTLTATGSGLTGDPQSLSAQVTPAAGGPATGWAEFFDGTTRISGLVPLDGTGKATAAPVFTTAGAHSLTAIYTPDDTALFSGSSSPSTSYAVTTPGATVKSTVTTLAVSPAGTAPVLTDVTLSATVAPSSGAGPAGTVAFKDGANTLQTIAVAAGATSSTAQLVTQFNAAGAHSFTAVFAPTDAAAFSGSASAAAAYSITAAVTPPVIPPVIPPTTPPVTAPVTENITVAIAAGSLTLSIATNPDVLLHGASGPTAPAELNTEGDLLVATGELNPVTVTDTRAQDQGATRWTVSGSIVDFSDGNTHAISGNNLGWTPRVIDKASTQTVTAGPPVAPARGVAAGSPASTAGLGLRASRVLASSTSGSSTGTAHVTAGLLLYAPTSTTPNTVQFPKYSALMTITAA